MENITKQFENAIQLDHLSDEQLEIVKSIFENYK